MKKYQFTIRLFVLMLIYQFMGVTILIAQDSQKYPTSHKIFLKEGNMRSLLLLPPVQNTVEISTLEIGEKYIINLNTEDIPHSCNPSISYINGNNDLISYTSGFEFTAFSDKLTLTIEPGCIAPYHSRLSLYISVAKKNGTTKLSNHISSEENRDVMGSLIGISGFGGTALIKNIFLGDPYIEISNINTIGGETQFGVFYNGISSINMESGLLITSGSCNIASGPNNAPGAGTSAGGGSDPDLLTLSNGSPIFDSGGIEFDFIPSASKIQFKYVFGSEEYEEYTCSAFNDVFGFFLSDGITTKNIALIPGTDIPVRINTVNQGSPGANGNIVNCTLPLGTLTYSGFYVSNPQGSNDVQYDGYTIVLTAEADVIPCKSYHLKMVVGDGGDAVFDSGVFIESNSLNSGADYKASFTLGGIQVDTLFESCSDGYIHFKRTNTIDFDKDLIVPIIIDSSSTATEGVDYSALPSTITITAGNDEYVLAINVLKDFIPEGVESIKFLHNNSCNSGNNYIELFIKDTYAIDIDTSETFICENDSLGTISATASGGVGNYSYLWSNGATSQSIQILPNDPAFYTVTITDACGNTATSQAYVKNAPKPTAIIQGSGTLCPDHIGEIALEVNFTGTGPWTLNYARNGIPQPAINNITNTPYTLLVWEVGNYTIESVEGKYGCKGMGTGEAMVDSITTMLIPIVIDTTICYKDTIVLNNQKISGNATLNFNHVVDNKCVNFIYHIRVGHTLDTLFNLCIGDIVNIANHNFNKEGEYILEIPQTSGCDSVLYISIKEHPKYQKINYINVSKGSIYKGVVINMDTTFVENLASQFGCDSLVVTHLKVTTATNNLFDKFDLRTSPNPATKQLTISADGQLSIEKWCIIDILGFKVFASDKEVTLPLMIDINSLSQGYYWWIGQNEMGKVALSFIKFTR